MRRWRGDAAAAANAGGDEPRARARESEPPGGGSTCLHWWRHARALGIRLSSSPVRQTFARGDGVLEHAHAIYPVIPVRMRRSRASRARARRVRDANSSG